MLNLKLTMKKQSHKYKLRDIPHNWSTFFKTVNVMRGNKEFSQIKETEKLSQLNTVSNIVLGPT
jgi:hypothetical protein